MAPGPTAGRHSIIEGVTSAASAAPGRIRRRLAGRGPGPNGAGGHTHGRLTIQSVLYASTLDEDPAGWARWIDQMRLRGVRRLLLTPLFAPQEYWNELPGELADRLRRRLRPQARERLRTLEAVAEAAGLETEVVWRREPGFRGVLHVAVERAVDLVVTSLDGEGAGPGTWEHDVRIPTLFLRALRLPETSRPVLLPWRSGASCAAALGLVSTLEGGLDGGEVRLIHIGRSPSEAESTVLAARIGDLESRGWSISSLTSTSDAARHLCSGAHEGGLSLVVVPAGPQHRGDDRWLEVLWREVALTSDTALLLVPAEDPPAAAERSA